MARPSLYHLPAKQAIAKAEEHMQSVLTGLSRNGKVNLYRVPWRDILKVTAATIAQHREFKQDEYGAFHPHKSDKWLYANYELGNALMLNKLASQLRNHGLLRKMDVELFKTALGKLYDNPPLEYVESQLKAFKSLVRKLGEIRARRLFAKANALWGDYGRALRKLSRNDLLSDNELLALGDMFGNPRIHRVFNHITFITTLPKAGVLSAYKLALGEQASPTSNAIITRHGNTRVVLPYASKYRH